MRQKHHMAIALGSIIIYARDMQKSTEFYRQHFGFRTTGEVVEGLIELSAVNGGASILIHQAAKSVKLGQVGVKLCFHVADIESFKAQAATQGLKFGATHHANGYTFANAKDPDKNSVSISSRAFRITSQTFRASEIVEQVRRADWRQPSDDWEGNTSGA